MPGLKNFALFIKTLMLLLVVIYHMDYIASQCISDISTLQFILDVICIIHFYNKTC